MMSKKAFDLNNLKHLLKYRSILALVISILIIIPAILPTFTMVVKAADIIVDDDGTGDYTSIQDAIDASSPGDTIWVKAGSYNEALTVNINNVKIIADNGAEPILYLSSYSPGIDIVSSDVRIQGFKIYGNTDTVGGPTIQLRSTADNSSIRENNFRVVTGEIGNTVMVIESGAKDILFEDNSITNYEIGVYLEDNTHGQIIDNSFSNVDYSVYSGINIEGTSDWYGTIQDAIDVAINEDTLSIVSGTFNENILINKSITIKGSNNGVNPTTSSRREETIIDGDTTSAIRIIQGTSNVVIDGLTIQIPNKSPASNEAGVLIQPGSTNINIKNNIFENITDGPGSDTIGDETYAIMVYGRDDGVGGQKDITIINNLIRNVEEYGIAINDNTSHVIISGNTVTDLLASDHAADPFWDPSWPEIVCSAIHLGGQVGPITNITITDNILMTEAMGDGVTTAAGSGISFAGVDEWNPPNRIWNGFEEIYISNNKITNNSMGIATLIGNTSGEITLHSETDKYDGNNISGNSQYAVNNLAGNETIINGINNWWGNITGPYQPVENPDGLGDPISENVTFWPWFEFGTEKNGYSIMPIVTYTVKNPNVDFGSIITDETEIEIDAQDNQSGIQSLTYRIWNTTHRWGPWMNYTGSFTFSSQGINRVQYNATDNSGKSAFTKMTSSFNPLVYEEHRVDSVNPFVEVIYPNGNEFESGVISIEWDAADSIFDQGQLKHNNSLTITEDYPGHVQSFIPIQDSIDSIQLLLSGDESIVSVKLFNEMFPVPTVIGQSVQEVGNIVSPTWIDFPFDSSISLDTSETYYIGVTQDITGSSGFSWYYHDDTAIDNYPFGHAWFKETDALVNESTVDFAFKTMYWLRDLDITVKYSNTGVSPWSTIAENQPNNGLFSWNTETYGIPDGPNYRIRIEAYDQIGNIGFDTSDETFVISNTGGPMVHNVQVVDTTIGDSSFTRNGHNLEISATITGDPEIIIADLSGFGKGTAVEYTTFTGGTATWMVNNILCVPSDGPVTFTITAIDAVGDSGMNSGSITADNTPPQISISKPRPGLYFMDSTRLLPFSYPFIIGQITFEADVVDTGSGVEKVEFYLENNLEATVTEPPYKWTWNQQATGFWDAEIVVTDRVGHEVFDEIKDLFIINLGIFT